MPWLIVFSLSSLYTPLVAGSTSPASTKEFAQNIDYRKPMQAMKWMVHCRSVPPVANMSMIMARVFVCVCVLHVYLPCAGVGGVIAMHAICVCRLSLCIKCDH